MRCGRREREGAGALRARPGRDLVEVHGPAAIAGRLDAQRDVGALGHRALPGRAHVGVERRRPDRLHLPEARPDRGRPPRRGGPSRGFRRAAASAASFCGRHRVEAQQPAAHVVADAAHARVRLGRVRPVDPAAQLGPRQRARAVAVPELRHRRRAAAKPVPASRRQVLLLDVVQVVAVVRVAASRRRRRARSGRRAPAARGRGLPAPPASSRTAPAGRGCKRAHQRREHGHAHERRGDQQRRPARPQPLRLARRRHQLGRRRLTRGQRRRQRVAARQHGGHRQRRTRARGGILLQAAQDRATRSPGPGRRRWRSAGAAAPPRAGAPGRDTVRPSKGRRPVKSS